MIITEKKRQRDLAGEHILYVNQAFVTQVIHLPNAVLLFFAKELGWYQ